MRITLTLVLGVALTACGTWQRRDAFAGADSSTDSALSEAPLKLAFLGDQGVGDDPRRVLELVVSEHADALVIMGDFAYDEASPSAWNAQLDATLGPDFPV